MPRSICYEMSSTLLKLRNNGFHVSRYGMHISCVYSLYFLYNGLMDYRDAFHAVLCLQKIAEYKAYWFMGFPIINP